MSESFKVQILTPNDRLQIESVVNIKDLRGYEGILSHLIMGTFGDGWDAQIVFPPRREDTRSWAEKHRVVMP